MGNSEYHIPVLLHPTVGGLDIDPNGVYVDATFGGGGHSSEVLKKLENGKLYAFDQDPDATNNLLDNENLVFVPQNFRFLKNYLRMYGVSQVDGVMADLGVSSHQFDEGLRGFSIRAEGGLDMRMNQNQELTAFKVVNEYEEDDLARVLYEFGELRNSRKVARVIVQQRAERKIKTTTELVQLIEKLVERKKQNQFLARVFQAIRIEVNDEMAVLKEFLNQAADVLKPGGRLVVISYHSLEDRLVKNFVKRGSFDGKIEKDFFGNIQKPFKEIERKAIVPSEEEIKLNNRARSAKLRIAEKL